MGTSDSSILSFMAITNICHLTDRVAQSALVFIVGIKTQSISLLLGQENQQVNTLQLNPSDGTRVIMLEPITVLQEYTPQVKGLMHLD